MKKITLLVSLVGLLSLSGCASIRGDFEYRQVDATVNNSRLVHKICVPEVSLNKQEFYHSDIHESGFFNSYSYTQNRDKLLCRYGVYETNITFNNPMNNRTVRGTVLTKKRYQRDELIPVYHRYRL